MVAWTVHGGRVEAACLEFGGAPADWLDLSTGISPHAWPGVEQLRIDFRALPEPGALAALEAAAAGHFGADPAQVCAVPGSEAGLRLLGHILRVDAHYVAPTYSTHAETFRRARAIGIEAIDEASSVGGAALVLANPNNPDGRQLGRDRLVEIARAVAESGGWLIVDEAFADVQPGTSLAPHVEPDLPIILFRSFGKFFGLAGVRLGFVIGPSEIIAAYRRLLGDWPVSSAAIAIGTAAYRDRDWIASMRCRLATEAAALDAILARHGLTSSGHCPLFRLIETPDAADLFERLARQMILTRPFETEPNWLRIGLPGDSPAFDRLDRALSHG